MLLPLLYLANWSLNPFCICICICICIDTDLYLYLYLYPYIFVFVFQSLNPCLVWCNVITISITCQSVAEPILYFYLYLYLYRYRSVSIFVFVSVYICICISVFEPLSCLMQCNHHYWEKVLEPMPGLQQYHSDQASCPKYFWYLGLHHNDIFTQIVEALTNSSTCFQKQSAL